jgi:DNA-binding MarR family transcriptional regulator
VSASSASVQTIRVSIRHLILGNDRYRRAVCAEMGIGVTELLVMSTLFNVGEQTPRQIADSLGVGTGTTTAILDRIVHAGFIERQPNPNDRRSVIVALTPAGVAAMEFFGSRTEDLIEGALSGMPDADFSRTAELLTAIGSALDHGADALVSGAAETVGRTVG